MAGIRAHTESQSLYGVCLAMYLCGAQLGDRESKFDADRSELETERSLPGRGNETRWTTAQ